MQKKKAQKNKKYKTKFSSNSSSNNNSKSKKSDNIKIDNTMLSIVIFSLSILMFFLILIPGENLWYGIHKFILGLFGIGSVFIPILLGYLSITSAINKDVKRDESQIYFSLILVLFICSLIYVFSGRLVENQYLSWLNYIIECYKTSKLDNNSGFIGAFIGAFLVWAFGVVGARIINIIILFVGIMIVTRTTLIQFFNIISKPLIAIKNNVNNIKWKNATNGDVKINTDTDNKPYIYNNDESTNPNVIENMKSLVNKEESKTESEDISKVTEKFLSRIKNISNNDSNSKDKDKNNNDDNNINENNESKLSVQKLEDNDYKFPPIDLFNEPVLPKNEDISSELNNNGRILVDTLKSFNVQTKIVDISRGPAVTRYELQPASGVKISKITTLSDDIALNLAAAGVRIEAPIPGKAAVGVEIPNKVVSIVGMKELISSSVFNSSKSKLTVVLGRDISGEVTVADLAKMPHLLIAGSTGSGKSVCINSFIISLLYNAKPSEVRLLMIDPKVVELGIYNGIPHLLVPVVTDARKAAGALGWAVNEMLNRYKKFAENNVRDIASYNEFVEQNPEVTDKAGEKLEKMPQIVIVIDELSDLMMAAPNEVEDYICRLAQMARAAGMYLVIATQRPSVDVITGIIKANIPSRIALAVSSQIDSRTILDMSGAEKLLGRGDMLFSPAGASKPIRIQGCYVTDKEIEKVINFVKTSQNSDYDNNIVSEIEKNAVRDNTKSSGDRSENDMDPVMKEAIKCIIEAGQASTSLLQRRLRVGYARAGRLIDEMEQMGIVGPHEGSKPRQVLINYQQFLEMNMNQDNT